MKGRLVALVNLPSNQGNSYGLIEINPDGSIQKVNSEGKKLLLSDDNDNNYLFHRIKNNEIKTKMHECFMGRTNDFIVTIDSQPYFFLFHRTFKEQKLEKIHVYMFNIGYLQNSHEHNNWNNHLLSSIGEKSDRSHVVLWAKELPSAIVFLRPLGLRLVSSDV